MLSTNEELIKFESEEMVKFNPVVFVELSDVELADPVAFELFDEFVELLFVSFVLFVLDNVELDNGMVLLFKPKVAFLAASSSFAYVP